LRRRAGADAEKTGGAEAEKTGGADIEKTGGPTLMGTNALTSADSQDFVRGLGIRFIPPTECRKSPIHRDLCPNQMPHPISTGEALPTNSPKTPIFSRARCKTWRLHYNSGVYSPVLTKKGILFL
jgi:hypothetical protein